MSLCESVRVCVSFVSLSESVLVCMCVSLCECV